MAEILESIITKRCVDKFLTNYEFFDGNHEYLIEPLISPTDKGYPLFKRHFT